MASEPDLLLLDEPTNHLDIDAIGWLEEFLLGFGGALLFITHDRVFLQKLATRIVELDRARLTVWPGDYNTYLQRKQAALAAAVDLESSLGRNPDKWLWGKVHRIEFVSPVRREGFGKGLLGGGSHPALGSGETLGRGIYGFNDPFDVRVIASLRMVADLADPDKVLAVLPGGVVGRLFDHHTTDQIESFMNGDKVYWWFSDAAITSHCRNTLVLKP